MRRLSWIGPNDDAAELVALRRRVYGGELGWIPSDGLTPDAAWDAYDLHSTTLLVHEDNLLVASGRLSLESDGPLEVSDLVDWRAAVPGALGDGIAAEWSRVIIAEAHRGRGLFRLMWEEILAAARARGVALLCGASTDEKRPLYEGLGFRYLDRPFRSSFFSSSPIYYPAYQRLR